MPTTALRQSPIDSSNFSPATKAKVRHWHDRAAALLSSLDVAIGHVSSTTESAIERVDRLLAGARVDLQVLIASLSEIHAAQADVMHIVLAPEAAAEAITVLSNAEVATLRSLHVGPPQVVREVMICTSTLLACCGCGGGSGTPRELVSWEEARRCVSGGDLKRRLLSADARSVAAAPELAQRIKLRLAPLGGSVTSRPRRGRGLSTAEPLSLQVAARSGGRAVGALYLWCARILAAADVERARASRVEEAGEADALEGVLCRARQMLDELEREREALGLGAAGAGGLV